MTQDLIDGFYQFKNYNYDEKTGGMLNLTERQDPKYFVISCIDSRSNPGTIFRSKPGIFFSHKAMGAIVRPYKQGTALSAALQFALEYNQIESIIILGHTRCGAIKAPVEEIDDVEISSFVNVTKQAVEKAKKNQKEADHLIEETEREAILESMENLKKYPSVAKALKENRITIKPWQFDIKSGDLYEYDPEKETFAVIKQENDLTDNRKTV